MRMIYNGVFGIELSRQGIGFAPIVPKGITNPKLTNLRYRNMLLHLSVQGEGTKIKSFKVNGIESDKAFISKDATGVQNVVIILDQL
ncbi:MAG: glycosyl hydrolase family 65 protein, partial [Bacteroidota bacterium]